MSYAGTDGTWNSSEDGDWTDTSKWDGGVVADGAGGTASFIADFTRDVTVTPNVAQRVIGHVVVSNLSASPAVRVMTSGSANNTQHLVFDAGETNGWSRIDVGANARFRTGAFAASNSIVKTGAGALYLMYANNTTLAQFKRTLRVDEGEIVLENARSFTGARLEIGGGSGDVILRTSLPAVDRGNLGDGQNNRGLRSDQTVVVSSNGTGKVSMTGDMWGELVAWNDWTLQRTLTIDNSTTFGIGGRISGNVGIYKTGSGRLDLGHPSNQFWGGAVVSQGALLIYEYHDALPGGTYVFGDENTGNASVRFIATDGRDFINTKRFIFADTGSSGIAQIDLADLWPKDGGNVNRATFRGDIQIERVVAFTNSRKKNDSQLVIRSVVSGAGGIRFESLYTQPNYVTLSGANTYSGGSIISNALVNIEDGGTFGTGAVVIGGSAANSARLYYKPTAANNHTLLNAIADDAALAINYGGIIDFTKVDDFNASATIVETVGKLAIGGRPAMIGTYGATGSGAKYIRDDIFNGSQGVIKVTDGPSPATLIIVQ
jgi:hypothetical protein